MSSTKIDFDHHKGRCSVDEKLLRLRTIHDVLVRCKQEHILFFSNFDVLSERLKAVAFFSIHSTLTLNTLFDDVGYSAEAFVIGSKLYTQMQILQGLHMTFKLSFNMDALDFTTLFGALIVKIADKSLHYKDLESMLYFVQVHMHLIRANGSNKKEFTQRVTPNRKKEDSAKVSSGSLPSQRLLSKTVVAQAFNLFVSSSMSSCGLSAVNDLVTEIVTSRRRSGYMTLE